MIELELIFKGILIGITIFEQILSFTPDGYPKSLSQLVIFGFYKIKKWFKKLFKKKKVSEEEIELIDIKISG